MATRRRSSPRRDAAQRQEVDRGQADSGARAGITAQRPGARRGVGAADSQKKSVGDLGGRGRRHERGERLVTLELVEEAVAAGARREAACEALGLSARTVERWAAGQDEDGRQGPNTKPANALTPAER